MPSPDELWNFRIPRLDSDSDAADTAAQFQLQQARFHAEEANRRSARLEKMLEDLAAEIRQQ